MAKVLIIVGVILLLLGIMLQYTPWTLNWFGKLPGDIRIETENGKIFIPVSSMLIVSIVLTILINLFRR